MFEKIDKLLDELARYKVMPKIYIKLVENIEESKLIDLRELRSVDKDECWEKWVDFQREHNIIMPVFLPYDFVFLVNKQKFNDFIKNLKFENKILNGGWIAAGYRGVSVIE